jgi:hypothetical protein
LKRPFRLFSVVGLSLVLAIVAGDLAVKPRPAKAATRESRDLPALSSSPAPDPDLSIPRGDFSNEPPSPGRQDPKPDFDGYDAGRSTVVSHKLPQRLENRRRMGHV